MKRLQKVLFLSVLLFLNFSVVYNAADSSGDLCICCCIVEMPNKVVPVPEKETIASKIIDTFNNLMFLNPDHDICEDVCPQICDYFGGQYCDDYITCDFPPAGEPQWDYDLFDCEESVVRCCKWVGDVLECPDWYWCSGHK